MTKKNIWGDQPLRHRQLPVGTTSGAQVVHGHPWKYMIIYGYPWIFIYIGYVNNPSAEFNSPSGRIIEFSGRIIDILSVTCQPPQAVDREFDIQQHNNKKTEF